MSEQNLREHWRTRATRTKHQKAVASVAFSTAWFGGKKSMWLPLVVTITRISPGMGLDSDNMVASQKHVRDAIASVIGVDDKDPRVTWRVEQRRGPWGVDIHVAALTGNSATEEKP